MSSCQCTRWKNTSIQTRGDIIRVKGGIKRTKRNIGHMITKLGMSRFRFSRLVLIIIFSPSRIESTHL